jgi:NAD(P)-dependent dehydrogenase (short-subunit alcohol dehydrogenase family)
MNIAGIGTAKRVVGKDGNAAPLEDFARVVNVNLIGSYNISRLFAAECSKLQPLDDGERGVMLFTASVAAFDGQVGQQAYSAPARAAWSA